MAKHSGKVEVERSHLPKSAAAKSKQQKIAIAAKKA